LSQKTIEIWLPVFLKYLNSIIRQIKNADKRLAKSENSTGSMALLQSFRTVLGINSEIPGFAKVKIEPHPGDLKNISREIPHPNGKLSVQYMKKDNKWVIEINLPPKTTGHFLWKGKNHLLKEGKNNFNW
jgi:alpha-L-rhamnosidase